MRDHHNKADDAKFEIFQELPSCGRDMKYANAVGKMVLTDGLDTGLPHSFNLCKNAICAKLNKTH